METEEKKFCICCNEDVTYSKLLRDGNMESVCEYCGYVVDVKVPTDPSAREDSLSESGQAKETSHSLSAAEDAKDMTVPDLTSTSERKSKAKASGPGRQDSIDQDQQNQEAKQKEEEGKRRAQVEKDLEEQGAQLEQEEQAKRDKLAQEEKKRRQQLEKEIRAMQESLEQEEQERWEQFEEEVTEIRETFEKEEQERWEQFEKEERKIKEKLSREKTARTADCIIIADGSALVRDSLKAMLVKAELTREVLVCENGTGFMVAFSEKVANRNPVDLVILDLDMPVMDGLTTAHAMRSMEKKYNTPKKIPILFFSEGISDDDLRREMKVLRPALYLNKGNTKDPAKLKSRIDLLVSNLLKKPVWVK